jgi:hypothetical protein
MARKKRRKQPPSRLDWLKIRRKPLIIAAVILALLLSLTAFTRFESYTSLYDAEYVGSERCGECHTVTYQRWAESPHANMTRRPAADTVVGDFEDGSWTPPPEARVTPDEPAAARMYRQGGDYYMALRDPTSGQYIPFKIAYVIGYQYRQTYLTEESGGVLRRLPLQWSTSRDEYFPYWNFQEGSLPTTADLWAQMQSLNSAWNLFCARCHTTHLEINAKDDFHTQAEVSWVDAGIACEACHGPGSHHVNYFAHNYVNRTVAFFNSRIRGEPAAYIASAPKLDRGEDLSVCARCHGADIFLSSQDIYRIYEPGYSREGRVNDISHIFQDVPLDPGRTVPTVETWLDGRPKGIGMLFRSFIESAHYTETDIRCYDCHDAHSNKSPAEPGILHASETSNRYCLACHSELAGLEAEHSNHEPGTSGYFCYDCHAPQNIQNIVSGTEKFVRTHDMTSIPNPGISLLLGVENAPNACSDCHSDQTVRWALDVMLEWYGGVRSEE